MAHIEYRASGGKTVTKAATAHEAVTQFLAHSKARHFWVQEYRDGTFTFSVGRPSPDDCFYKTFKSREDARAWLVDQPGA